MLTTVNEGFFLPAPSSPWRMRQGQVGGCGERMEGSGSQETPRGISGTRKSEHSKEGEQSHQRVEASGHSR